MPGQVNDRIENIKTNIESVSRRLEFPVEAHEHCIQLICFGPSLRRTWGLIDRTKPIATVSGAHDFLRKNGIIPTYHVEFDWRPHKAKHVSDPKDTLFWLASCVHPDLVKKINDPVLWHAQQTDAENSFILARENARLVPGGSSAGLRAIELFHALGYRAFEIHGMDSSFEERQWAGPHYGTSRLRRKILEITVAGRKFKTSMAFLTYVDQFMYCKKLHPESKFTLHGNGLLQTVSNMEKIA